ncbi:hypothetical protein BD310DRAFT_946699 [Dichomitus squalens]|uniref:Uncharacterized protein n=1 Tax=Dichomitus squalens TaxID=114155 RepID=A0A4Q9Q3S9_9APHY|nr:hypothetical protein BD310DRAFT_946699 [Dichomitus squalens]
MAVPDDPPGHPAPNGRARDVEKPGEQHATASEVEGASRQSTPLSELSSAPETAPDDEVPNGDGLARTLDGDATSAKPGGGGGGASAATKDGNSASQQQTFSSPASQAPSNTNADGSTAAGGDQSADGTMIPKMALGQHFGQLSLPDRTPSSQALSRASSHDPKVVSILELNSLLLRVSMEYQARGVPMTEPGFHQYSLRLQSNLTWLAAAADDSHKVSPNLVALPIMQPPPIVEFSEMERIVQIYRELPTVFAKEIARRQQQGMNGNAKRERTEEPGPDNLHKRRDTGETKAPTTPFITPGPSTPHPPSQPMQPVMNPMANLSAGPVPRMGSPAMPPPPVPPGAMGANEAQLAAMRARQQMRMAAMQQQPDGRQMSPPSGMMGMGMGSMQNVAGPSSMANVPQQLTPQQMAALQAMGPQAVQNFQALQTPGHPFVQYLTQQMPGFPQLPLQEKLQKMQMAQQMLQARQQQRNAQAQGGGAMGAFPQGGMQGGLTPQHTGDGSPSRMSPVSQSPMQPSFPQNAPGDPRSMMTPQQQQVLASMNPQQRQLYLMQQQMLRGGQQVGGGMNPQMMNPQQVMQERMRIEQQRLAQAQAQAAASGHVSPPNAMGSPMVDGPQFPALRSNPGMPGIARSTRTPSDSNPSPVSGQRMSMSGQSPEDQQRAMMMQQAQVQQRGMAPQQQQMQAGFGNGNPMANQAYAAHMQQMGMGAQNPNPYGMGSPPGSAGGAPSPAAGGQMYGGMGGQGFPGAGGGGGGPFMAPSPSASQHDGMTPGRQTSATPAPHPQMGGANPGGDQVGLSELDFFNWGQ